VAQGVPGRLRSRIFLTFGTTRVVGTEGDETVDRLIYDCGKLAKERGKLIAHVSREDNWPVQKSVLVNKYLKQYNNEYQ